MKLLIEETTLVFIFFIAIYRASGQACTVGRSDDSELGERNDRRFYLDVNNPATCHGTITNWTVCYYGRSDSSFNSYWATYAVYQRVDSGSYERVSEMFRAVRTTTGFGDGADGLNQIGFNCYTDFIDAGDSPVPLTIRAGDIIGACVFNPQDADGFHRRQLNIVGEVLGESLMRADIFDVDCTMDAIPSSVQLSDLRYQNNRRLHIYANIQPAPESTTTTAHEIIQATASNTMIPDSTSINEADQESMGSLIATIAGSTSGVFILILLLVSLIVVVSVVMYLKHRQKAFNLTSNVAYAGQCKNEDIDYYSISQLSPETGVENKNDECLITNDTAANQLPPIYLEAQQPCEEGVNLEQNVAYKPTKVVLSPNVAYKSHDHVHQGAESQDEYEYNYI